MHCRSSENHHASVQQGGPNISLLDPALQQQWDHATNAHLGLVDIKPYSNKKVRWVCDQCPDGHLHSWEAQINNRTNGRGCPQCTGRKVCKHNSLATKAPKVAAQWDYGVNAGTPDTVMAQSNHRVGWLCEVCGEQWDQSPNQRVGNKGVGCPKCARAALRKKRIRHPTFAECQDPYIKAVLAEWDHERNAAMENFPDNTRLRSSKQIFWLCNKCPAGQQHSWSAVPHHRTTRGKRGCPVCAGKAACKCNSLAALYPATAAEWDYAKNEGRPEDYTGSCNHKAWWSSLQHGSWQQSINSRTSQLQERQARLRRVQQRHHLARDS